MYLDEIHIRNLRVFADARAAFQYPGRVRGKGGRVLDFPNLNLILGNNGAGKTSLLRAIALAALGPLAEKFSPYMLVRRAGGAKRTKAASAGDADRLQIDATFQKTWQDRGQKKPDGQLAKLESSCAVARYGDEESVVPKAADDPDRAGAPRSRWRPIFEQNSPAFLTVGYGATRRVDTDANAATPAQKMKSSPLRHQRVQSVFTEGYTLVQLGHWLPQLKSRNPGRYKQVCDRINDVLPDGIEFTGRTDRAGEYLFAQGGALVPFAALSDGCRAFLGWVADLLYHICFGCPSGVKLVDNCGMVLVDEVDLHLHPDWQRIVLPRLAKTFPRLQFIVTTHSPIVVGTLQRENLWVCEPGENGSILTQKEAGVQGLNSDQILLTEYFGLKSSRAPAKEKELRRIAAAAERKVPGQAAAFLRSLITPLEDKPAK